MTAGIEDPLTYVYRGAYCDIWRAVDVLLDRREVDPARVGITGGSQGGALSLVPAAGRSEITAVAADVPFLTGIRDSLRLGSSYPYEEIKDYLRQRPDSLRCSRSTAACVARATSAPIRTPDMKAVDSRMCWSSRPG